MSGKTFYMIRSLLVAYVITGISLMILAVSMYKWNLTKTKIDMGILGIYLLSNLIGGFSIGKQIRERKFAWGILAGFLYFLLLAGMTFLVCHEFQGDAKSIIITLVLCAGGGMIGGMIS